MLLFLVVTRASDGQSRRYAHDSAEDHGASSDGREESAAGEDGGERDH